MDDDLHRPLGQNPRDAAQGGPWRRRSALGAGLVVLSAVGAAAFWLAPRDPFAWSLGGRPYAIAKIEAYQPPPEPAARAPQEANASLQQSEAPQPTPRNGSERLASGGEVEIQNGVRVVRTGGGAGGVSPMIIEVDPASSVRLPPAPDKRVSEKGRYGVLPRMGADGVRPMDVYSRPFVASSQVKAGAPRIALIVGGLGLNAPTTEAALAELPESVTLAFAPYGANVAADAARARARGHETLLQAPMEPFDYPRNNPGPHTLLVEGGAGADDLHWLMSRFTGYAGVMSYLGGRFSADERALAPVLGEIAERGLFMIDDGAAPQSVIIPTATRLSLRAARVDIALDSQGTPQSLEAALAQLEAQARRSGSAIGFASARASTITRLARFSREVEKRGVVIAPASALVSQSGASAAAGGDK
jgi:polysaccharide deacetylase 2 family uncharacterized protein YibQ